ncbi:hypothetical protein ADIAL_1897 [Alkalibacterium sp. AK22]|uniref:hypothetical protein n=1 Tax=Alkalibacterium sp. AK22 TaxID=1229520 RepID=UPI00044D89C8|nr:hypothetical protein [Alkalibacterium sp. AK22]EXJ22643.1 hypothetical protein ADIAL_1897 [Alkalibacterium sp. AK22]
MKEIYNEYYYVLRETVDLDLFFEELFSIERKNKNSDTKIIRIGKQNFDFQYNNKNYKCYYEVFSNYKNEETVSLKIGIYYEKNKERAAKVLSEVLLKISKNTNNKFYSIAIEDNLSMYYSIRTFKHLAVYERSLRKLIISIFVPLHSKDWSKIILTQVPDFKGAGNKDNIEKGLEKLSLSKLEDLFFKKRLLLNSQNFNEIFNTEDIKKMNKEELVQLIEKAKPYSLWDKHFYKFAKVENPEKIMKEIKKERDKIAHHRYFSKKSYENVTKNLNYLIPKIQKANDNIVSHQNRSMIIDFASILKNLPELVKNVQESFKILADTMAKNEIFLTKLNIPKAIDLASMVPKVEMPNIDDIASIMAKIDVPKYTFPEFNQLSDNKDYSDIFILNRPNFIEHNYLNYYRGNQFFISGFINNFDDKELNDNR